MLGEGVAPLWEVTRCFAEVFVKPRTETVGQTACPECLGRFGGGLFGVADARCERNGTCDKGLG